MTHMGFESTQELQAFLRQANRIANEMLAPEQRELTYGSCWIRFLGTGRQMEFGRVIRQEEVTLLMLLDKVKPGWEQRINVETLNLESAMECVLGQLYGSYADGLSALWPRQQVGWQRLSWSSYDEWDQMAEAHGFEAPLGDRCTRRCVLAQEWKRHVLRKQYVSA